MTTQITEIKKVIGFTDSVRECDCCGKSGLKGTFCVSINGTELYYGSTCAFKKHGIYKKEIDKSIRLFINKKDDESRKQKSINHQKYLDTLDWD